MKNNRLIVYKENIFIKIRNFIKKFFDKNEIYIEKKFNNNTKNNFWENIHIKEDAEEIRIKKLQQQYDNGEIDEDDLSEEDVNKIIKLYEEETEQLKQDNLRRKIHIQNMLKELKYNN